MMDGKRYTGARKYMALRKRGAMKPLEPESKSEAVPLSLPEIPGLFHSNDSSVQQSSQFKSMELLHQSTNAPVSEKSSQEWAKHSTSTTAKKFYARAKPTQTKPFKGLHVDVTKPQYSESKIVPPKLSSSHRQWESSNRPTTSSVNWEGVIGNDSDPVNDMISAVERRSNHSSRCLTKSRPVNAQRDKLQCFREYVEQQKSQIASADREKNYLVNAHQRPVDTVSRPNPNIGFESFNRSSDQRHHILKQEVDSCNSSEQVPLSKAGRSKRHTVEEERRSFFDRLACSPEQKALPNRLNWTDTDTGTNLRDERRHSAVSIDSSNSARTEDFPGVTTAEAKAIFFGESMESTDKTSASNSKQRSGQFLLPSDKTLRQVDKASTTPRQASLEPKTGYLREIGKRSLMRFIRKKSSQRHEKESHRKFALAYHKPTHLEDSNFNNFRDNLKDREGRGKHKMKRIQSKAGVLGDILGDMLKKNGLCSRKDNQTSKGEEEGIFSDFGAPMDYSSSKQGGNSHDPMLSTGGMIVHSAHTDKMRAIVRETRVLAVRRGDALAARAIAAGIRQFELLSEEDYEEEMSGTVTKDQRGASAPRDNPGDYTKFEKAKRRTSMEHLAFVADSNPPDDGKKSRSGLSTSRDPYQRPGSKPIHSGPQQTNIHHADKEDSPKSKNSKISADDKELSSLFAAPLKTGGEGRLPALNNVCHNYSDVRSEMDLRRLLRAKPEIANEEGATGSAELILSLWNLFTLQNKLKGQNVRRKLGTNILTSKVRKLWIERKEKVNRREALSMLRWQEELGIPVDESKMFLVNAQLPPEYLEKVAADERHQRIQRWRQIAPKQLE